MAIVTVPRFHIPRPPIANVDTAPASSATVVIDAASEKAEFICDAPRAGNIRKIHWRTLTVSVTSGPLNFTVGIETLNRGATPSVGSGTPWGTNTNATVSIGTNDDNTSYATQLTADATVLRGDPICIHWTSPGSGTFSVQIAAITANLSDLAAYPYTILNGALLANRPQIALEYDDGVIIPIPTTRPITAYTTTTFGSGSNPNTIGERFQVAGPLRCCGFWLLSDADDDFTAKLVSTSYHRANATGILASRTVKTQDRKSNGAGRYAEWDWTTAYELAANTYYRWVIEPGATGIQIYDFSVPSLALLDSVPGGQDWHLSTANNPTGDGDWTNHNSGTFKRLWGGLIFDGVSNGVGGGHFQLGVV